MWVDSEALLKNTLIELVCKIQLCGLRATIGYVVCNDLIYVVYHYSRGKHSVISGIQRI